jgi:hypothetical protein
MAKNWIKDAINPQHKGDFKRKAKSAGMTVSQYANKVTRKGSHASTETKLQAHLAKTLMGFHRKGR